jgi:organic radical activating enzyme
MKTDTLTDPLQEVVTTIPVMEQFLTLQGEGFHTGKAAYFIRTGGCDVGCHWCDVKESWDASHHNSLSYASLLAASVDCDAEIIVITGGEPLMYDLEVLCALLRTSGKSLHVETSGVYPLTGSWDWICFSPKKFKSAQTEYYHKAHELKVVIYNAADLAWAEEHAEKMNADAKLYLQPEWSKKDQIMPLIVEYVKANPKWRISLQTHKYLNIP